MKRPLFAAGLTAFTALIFCMTLTETGILIISAVIFAADMIFCFLRNKRRMRTAAALTAVWAAATLLFFAHASLRVTPSLILCGQTVSVEGRLAQAPQQKENSLCCELKQCRINGQQTTQTVTVYVRAAALDDASLYDTVYFPAVRLNSAPKRDAFYFHGLSNDAWLSGWANAGQIKARYTGYSPLYLTARLRQNAFDRVCAALPASQAEIAAALLLGRNDALSPALKSQLRVAGASHLFAVSGMHLSLWSAVIFLILRKRAKTKNWANAAAGLFVLFYIALTGFSPSVLRAGVMLLTVYIGRIRRLQADPLNSLGLAALLLLAANPFLAGNVSFLLSFFATAAILILFPFFNVGVPGKRTLFLLLQRQGAAVVNGIALSLGVLFFTVPVSGLFFGGVSLLSPLSSVFCTLPAEGVMLTGASGLLFAAAPPLSSFCFRLSGFCAELLSRAVGRLAKADFLYVDAKGTVVLLWYVLTVSLAFFVYCIAHKNKQAVVNLLLISASVILVFGGIQRLTQQHAVRLYLPDAGNTTAVCLQFGDCGNYLIGAGETYEQTRALLDALAEKGAVNIDGLIVPTKHPAESGQSEYVGKTALPKRVFTVENVKKLFPDAETYCCASDFRIGLPEGRTYTNICNEVLRAGLLEGGSSVVFSFSPANDFSAADPAFRSGDCLVCRAGLPKGLDPLDFRLIFVLTDKIGNDLNLPENARSVHDLKGVDLRL